MTTRPADAPAPPRVPLRLVLVPSEHGGWAFLAEPVALGLIVAFSPAGLPLAVATLAAFLARQPLKLLAADLRKGRRYPRTALAGQVFATLALIAALSLGGALLLARGPLLLALGLAAPLAAASLAFDLGLRSRAAAAEVAGALALAASSSAIALAAGQGAGPALGLWAILAARIVPTIVYVRARVRLERGAPAGIAGALVAGFLGVAWAAAMARLGLAPWLATASAALLALRAAWGLSRWRPRMTTMQLGIVEIVLGAIHVAAIAVGLALRL